MPALSSSLISPALEQIADLPAGDREVLAASRVSVLEHLAQVPDPRKRRGVRHSLSSVLAAAIAAVMAGPKSFTAIGRAAIGGAVIPVVIAASPTPRAKRAHSARFLTSEAAIDP